MYYLSPSQRQERERAVNKVKEMIAFARKEFNIPDFTIMGKYSFSTRRSRSNGGVKRRYGKCYGWISIQMARYSGNNVKHYFEYKQIENHKTIGNFDAPAPLCQDATLAHEVAHAVEYFIQYQYTGELHNKVKIAHDFNSGREFRGHGKTWQYIYHVLREKFVNGYVDKSVKIEPVIAPKVEVKPFVIKPLIITPVINAQQRHYAGSTNIAKVCNMYSANRDKNTYWLLDEIVKMLGVKRGNAKIYLQKARERYSQRGF